VRRRRDVSAPHDGWTSELASGIALAGFLTLVFVGFTLLAMGPLMSLDAYLNLDPAPPGWLPFLHVLDRIGQRGVNVPVLAVVAYVCSRRSESWRPVVVALLSTVALNLVVGLLKIGLGRGQPESADPSFFVGGMAYPSGHTSNIILVYGLSVYLLGRYTRVPRRTIALLWSVVALLAVTMVVTSLTLNWHWFADLIAGLLIGSVILQLTVSLDQAVPSTAYETHIRPAVNRALARIRRRPEPPALPRHHVP
jgi:membrane-associated phospholipid phosphatase